MSTPLFARLSRMIHSSHPVSSPSTSTSNNPTPVASNFRHTGPPSPMTPHSIPPPSPYLVQPTSTFMTTRFPLLSRSGTLSSQASSMTLASSSSLTNSSSGGAWVGVTGARQTSAEGVLATRRGLGYMWPEAGLVLGLEDLVGLVEDCGRELIERGKPHPYIRLLQSMSC
jgi:hypothetical protein